MLNTTITISTDTNNTTNLTHNVQDNQGKVAYYFRSMVGFMIVILHILIIITIVKTKQLQTVSNYFKCGLSLGGIVMGLSAIVQGVLGISNKLDNPSACMTILMFLIISTGVTMSSVLLLYVEAFLVARYTLINRNFFSKRCGAGLLGVTWIMWMLFALLGFGTRQPNMKGTVCQVNNGQLHRNYLLIVGVVFVAHILILILLQIGVYLRIKVHITKFQENENVVLQSSKPQSCTTETQRPFELPDMGDNAMGSSTPSKLNAKCSSFYATQKQSFSKRGKYENRVAEPSVLNFEHEETVAKLSSLNSEQEKTLAKQSQEDSVAELSTSNFDHEDAVAELNILDFQHEETVAETSIFNSKNEETVAQSRILNFKNDKTVAGPSTLNSKHEETVAGPSTFNSKHEEIVAGPSTFNSKHEETVAGPSTFNSKHEETVAGPSTFNSKHEEIVAGPSTFDSKHEEIVTGPSTFNSKHEEIVAGSSTFNSKHEEIVAGPSTFNSKHEEIVTGPSTLNSKYEETVAGSSTFNSKREETVAGPRTLNFKHDKTFTGSSIHNSKNEEPVAEPSSHNPEHIAQKGQGNKIVPICDLNAQNKRRTYKNWMHHISKLCRQICAILVAFILCFTPYTITNFISISS
ncbi:unnamed protein product, partial [Owenia fusiformis]